MSRFYHLEFLTSFCNRFVLGFYSAAALAFEWLLNKSRTQIAWQAMIMAEAKRKKFILKLWQNEKKKKKKKKLMKWREKIVSRIAQNLFACKSMPGHFFCFSIVSSLSSIPFISCLISLIARFLSLCLSLLKHFSMSDIVIVIALGTDLIVKLIAIVTINRFFFSVGRRCFRVSLELKRNRLLLFPVCVCVSQYIIGFGLFLPSPNRMLDSKHWMRFYLGYWK